MTQSAKVDWIDDVGGRLSAGILKIGSFSLRPAA